MEKKRKLYGTILGVIMFILLVLGFTYAYSSWISSKTNIGINSDCFIIDYTTGDNINSNDESIDITSNDLFLLNETDFLTNTSITITEGMALTSVSMGLNSACNINGVGTINLNVTELSGAFTSTGDSYGSLKYVLAEYSSVSYPTVTVEALNNSIFNIVSKGVITGTGNIELNRVSLTHGATYEYLIIFYIDEVIAQNNVATATFKGTISAEAVQKGLPTAAQTIVNLYNPDGNTKPIINNITYNLDTTNRLMQDAVGNIRYYGLDDPDDDNDIKNHIYFNCETYPSTNCETWRIIGVFDGKIKIMRNEYIGRYSWDTSASTVGSGYGVNEWSQSDIMKLLNPGYENNKDLNSSGSTITVNNSLYWTGADGKAGLCYNNNNNATTTCDFTSTGLKNSETRNLIATNTYATRGYLLSDIPLDELHDEIMNTGAVNQNPSDGIARNTTWNGKIGLIYITDYAYAADLSLCQTSLDNYGNNECTTNNWMKNLITYHSWSMTPYIERDFGMNYIYTQGRLYAAYTSLPYDIFPVLYLESNVEIVGGTGAENNPYQIG